MMIILSLFKSISVLQMKIKFMYENNCPLVIFLRLNGIAKIKNAKNKMLCFETQIAKISNRRKYPLYGKFGFSFCVLLFPQLTQTVLFAELSKQNLPFYRTFLSLTGSYCLLLIQCAFL